MQFAMLPLQGLAQGAQPITSYNYGAKNKERVKKSFFSLLKVSLIYSITLWALIMIFPHIFAGIFTSKSELIEFAAKALRIYCAVLLIFGIQIAAQMTFISLGKALSSIIVAVVRKFVLLLPLIYVVPLFIDNKTIGVYLAEPIADTLAVTFTAILFTFQFRKALKMMDNM
jgi:Na+-driven multidrug efflux pump